MTKKKATKKKEKPAPKVSKWEQNIKDETDETVNKLNERLKHDREKQED